MMKSINPHLLNSFTLPSPANPLKHLCFIISFPKAPELLSLSFNRCCPYFPSHLFSFPEPFPFIWDVSLIFPNSFRLKILLSFDFIEKIFCRHNSNYLFNLIGKKMCIAGKEIIRLCKKNRSKYGNIFFVRDKFFSILNFLAVT